jgi:hypothetical protein
MAKQQPTKREQAPPPAASHKPAATLRHGNLKCVIWRNEGEKGPWYVADLIRTFKTEAGYQETSKVNADDLLRVAFLAQQAFAEVLELKAADRAAATDHDGFDEPAPY